MSTLSQKGFTIIELLTVIIVIAILTVVAAPSLIGMLNKNKVVASTNELIGLIEFAKNTAKSTSKIVYISKCADGDSCGFRVGLSQETGASPLRVMHKQDTKNISIVEGREVLAFYPDGTRGLRVNSAAIRNFNEDGSFNSSSVSLSTVQATGDFTWKVKNGDFCRVITVTTVGNVKVATEGC